MFDKEHEGEEMEEGMGHMGHMGCCGKGMKKEFKMAMLKKKEKMLEAKLEFIREVRGILEKEMSEPEKK